MQFCLMEKRRDSSIHAKWILIEFSKSTVSGEMECSSSEACAKSQIVSYCRL